jgi:hypothetical protein
MRIHYACNFAYYYILLTRSGRAVRPLQRRAYRSEFGPLSLAPFLTRMLMRFTHARTLAHTHASKHTRTHASTHMHTLTQTHTY